MGLRNLFGEIALEETQKDTGELLLEVLTELKIMNVHLQHLSDQRVTKADVEEEINVN